MGGLMVLAYLLLLYKFTCGSARLAPFIQANIT